MKYSITLLTTFYFFLFFGLTAQDTLDLETVEVVSNPAWAVRSTGGPVAVLPSGQLRADYYGQEPALLLERMPSVTAFTDAGSPFGYAYFRLRGIDQTRLNFTLDGIPLNEPEDQGFYFNNYVDLLSSIRAVQLQPGVNVRVNGTAAYAGSVQLLSPAASVAENGGEVSLGYGSFGSYRLSAMLRRRLNAEGSWTLYARGSRLGSKGFKEHSDHEGTSAFAQAAYTKGKHLLKLTAFGGNQQNQMAWLGGTDSLLTINPRVNTNSEQERDNFTTTLARAQYTRLSDGPLQWSASLYHGFQNGNYDFDLNNFLGFAPTEELYNYAFRYHNFGALANASYEKDNWEWQMGFHGQHYARRHVGSERSLGQLYENTGTKKEASAFTRLARKIQGLHLRAGAQVRHVGFSYDGSVPLAPLRFTFLNYSLEARQQLGAASLYYRFGSTGREPTRNDVFGGNDDLLPTENGAALTFVTEAERVFDHEFGLVGKNQGLSYSVNLFYLRFQNEIVLSGAFGPNGLPLRSSVARSFRTGLEWQLNYALTDKLSFYQNGALSKHQITQDGTTFTPVLSPPVLLQQGGRLGFGQFTAGLDIRYQSASYLDFANDHEIENFVTLDASIRWQKARWAVSAFAFNLNDATYATNGQLDIYGRPTFHRRASTNGWVSITYQL